VSKALAANQPPEQLVEQAFLAALARPPSAAEQQRFVPLLAGATDPKEKRLALEDTYWALLSSNEFLFNH
jgi:hypothetical protein